MMAEVNGAVHTEVQHCCGAGIALARHLDRRIFFEQPRLEQPGHCGPEVSTEHNVIGLHLFPVLQQQAGGMMVINQYPVHCT
ncbi:hypothetical protein D3C80_1589120 [compost metagenome]